MTPIRVSSIFLSPLMLALAACGQPVAPPTEPPKAENPGPPLTPNPMPPSYIGRWAATIDQCQTGAWVFTDKGLTTAGEVSCTFSQVTPNETGWIAEGACTAQAPAAPASLVLNTTRGGGARTLAVSGGPFTSSQVLAACPEPAPQAPAPAAPDEAAAIDIRVAAGADPAVKPYEFKHKLLIAKAWRVNDQVIKIVEPRAAAAGRPAGERSYYFRPGETDPFLVRHEAAAYAFEGGKLTSVAGVDGASPNTNTPPDKGQIETRVLTRARELRIAADG